MRGWRAEACRSELINPAVRHCECRAVPVSLGSTEALGFPWVCLAFLGKYGRSGSKSFRPLYQKAGPRQEPSGKHNPGNDQAGHRGLGFSGVSRAFQLEEFELGVSRQE